MVRRNGIDESLTWYFPSGTVSGGEDIVARAMAEVKDETGIECRFEKRLGQREHPDTHVYIYYVALSYVGGQARNLDPEENIEVEWVPAGEARGRVSTNLDVNVSKFLDRLKS
jgi:8-oxo-dGTP diphosphatase